MTIDWSKAERGKFFGKKPKITMAETSLVERAQANKVTHLLQAIGKQLYGPEDTENWKSIWVSDKSTLGDFDLEPEQLEVLGQEIGFPVKHEDYIHEIIFKMP